MNNENKTIGIFGGTFNPPTWAHLQVAQAALDSGKVDFVEFLPCWKHAFGKEPSDFFHRVKMCELITEDNPCMGVSGLEGKLKTTYSIDILEAFTKAIKEYNSLPIDFRLIMGADNYWKMDQWKNPEKVKELAPPLWVSRPGTQDLPFEEEKILLDNHNSSTGLRNAIKNNRPEASNMTRSTVFDYIMMNNLYR